MELLKMAPWQYLLMVCCVLFSIGVGVLIHKKFGNRFYELRFERDWRWRTRRAKDRNAGI